MAKAKIKMNQPALVAFGATDPITGLPLVEKGQGFLFNGKRCHQSDQAAHPGKAWDFDACKLVDVTPTDMVQLVDIEVDEDDGTDD